MDLSKLKNSDKIIALGGIIGVVAAFLPWWSWQVNYSLFGASSGTSGSINGLNGWWMISFIAAIISFLLILLPLLGVSLPNIGIKESVLQMILGLVVGGIPVLALLSGSSSGAVVSEVGSAGPSFGLFGAIAAGVIILFGGFTAQKGESTPQAPQAPQTPQSPQA